MLQWQQQAVKGVLSFKTQGDAYKSNLAENVLLKCSKQNALLTHSPSYQLFYPPQKDMWVDLFRAEIIS